MTVCIRREDRHPTSHMNDVMNESLYDNGVSMILRAVSS